MDLAASGSTAHHHHHHQIVLKSPLSPDQLRVLSLYHQCGIRIDHASFLSIWKLISLGIPSSVVTDLLRDVAAYSKKSSF